MINAYWLIPALMIGAGVGFTVCALCVAAAKDN